MTVTEGVVCRWAESILGGLRPYFADGETEPGHQPLVGRKKKVRNTKIF